MQAVVNNDLAVIPDESCMPVQQDTEDERRKASLAPFAKRNAALDLEWKTICAMKGPTILIAQSLWKKPPAKKPFAEGGRYCFQGHQDVLLSISVQVLESH